MNRTIDNLSLQLSLFLAICLSIPSSVAFCQDDPFGSSDGSMDPKSDAFGAATSDPTDASPAAGTAKSSYFKTDPLIRRVRDNPPTNAPEMAKALTWMVQLRSWETVGTLLDRVAASNWSLENRAQLAREISPAIWSQLLRSTNKLSEAQVKTLSLIQSSPATYAKDPRIIDALIDQLGSSNSNQQKVAQLRLQDGQRAALSRVMDRLLEGDAKIPVQRLAETAMQFDRDGVDSLRAACNIPDATRSARVVLSLADVAGNKPFSNELAASLYSNRYSPEVKQALAEKILATYAKLPSEAAAIDFLSRSFQDSMDDYQKLRIAPDNLTTTVWHPDPNGKLTSREVTRDIAALERLAQLACLRSQLQSADPAMLTLATVIQLQRAYQLNPSLVDSEIASNLLQPLPAGLSSEATFWAEVFRQASQLQMHGAAVRSLQLLHAQVQTGKSMAPLDFLSGLLSDGRPVVRYLALEIIASANPTADYAASERALATALEMTQMSHGPQALIIGGNNELCMAADQIIQLHTSTESVTVNSARSAIQSLAKQKPIEFIVVVDRIHDMSLFELLQRLRNSGSLPIAVLVERLHQHEQDLIDKGAGFYRSHLSRDPELMKQVMDQLTRALDVKPLTSEDRTKFAVVASKFLTRIAADRSTYAFYPLSHWHEQLASLPTSVSPSSQSQLLSGLGTNESQRMLTSLVSTAGITEEERMEAAKSFATSVRQFGIQLSDPEIKRSYELYNQLGPNDPAIAKAMGYVLDIIEAQTGSRTWPVEP